jgi:hypothetical protein
MGVDLLAGRWRRYAGDLCAHLQHSEIMKKALLF